MNEIIKFRLLMFSMLFLPLFSSFLFITVPNFSKTNFYIAIILVGFFGFIYGLIMLLGLTSSRFYLVIQFDLFCLFAIATTLKVYNYNTILSLFSVVIYFGSIFIASKYPKTIKRIRTIGAIGIAPASVLGIAIGKLLPIKASAPLFLLVSVVILLLIHSAWVTRKSPEKKNGPI